MLLRRLPLLLLALPAPAQELDPAAFEDLSWRCIGPWRGGRVTAVDKDNRIEYVHCVADYHLNLANKDDQCDSGLGAYRLYEMLYQEKDQKVGQEEFREALALMAIVIHGMVRDVSVQEFFKQVLQELQDAIAPGGVPLPDSRRSSDHNYLLFNFSLIPTERESF